MDHFKEYMQIMNATGHPDNVIQFRMAIHQSSIKKIPGYKSLAAEMQILVNNHIAELIVDGIQSFMEAPNKQNIYEGFILKHG